MNCPADGLLRTFFDGEVTGGQLDAVCRHVRDCEKCQARLSSLQAQADSVREKLDALAQETDVIDSRAAYERYRQAYQHPSPSRTAWASRFAAAWGRPLLGGLTVVCAIVMMLSFSPGRTWAQRVLEMLRVQKVAVVPVDLSALTAQGDNGHAHLLAQFISDNVTVTMKPGPSVPVADAAAASQTAGFAVRTLDQLGTPYQVQVRNQGAFQMTLDRDRMQAVLDQGGRSDIQIPDSVDGSLIAVHVPKAVRLDYGSCGQNAKGAGSSSNDDSCLHFMQVPSPIVSIPPGLNIAALAEAGLQIAGMSASEAHSYAQTVDWSSTLVIPVTGSGSYRTVPVDGVSGTLVETGPHGSYPGTYNLIWVKNGIVYSIWGKGTSDRALAAAESLS